MKSFTYYKITKMTKLFEDKQTTHPSALFRKQETILNDNDKPVVYTRDFDCEVVPV